MANYNMFNLFVNIGGLSQVVIKDNEFHEAMLIVSDDAIRLDVKFPDLDKICHRMATWNNEISFDSFGKLVFCKNNSAYNESKNESVTIDFSESKLLTYKGSTDSPYISFFIDKIQYSYDYPTDKDEAIFWLNNAGYKFVQDYYNVDWGIELPKRMNIKAHDILGARCYPYFDFYRTSESNSREIIIRKSPKVKWYDFDDIESVVKYNGWICQLASLFYGNDINYTGGQIDYNNRRTFIFQIVPASTLRNKYTFLYFNGLHKIYQFINAVSFELFQKTEKQLIPIVRRFIQSLYLDASTRYLVLYNILEIRHSVEKENQTPELVLEGVRIKKALKLIRKKLNEAYNGALQIVESKKEKDRLDVRYKATKNALDREPTSYKMQTFIEDQKFDISLINSYIKREIVEYDFFELRNKVIHGSCINNLETASDILEHIDIILILKLLGCPIQVNDVFAYSDIYKGE